MPITLTGFRMVVICQLIRFLLLIAIAFLAATLFVAPELFNRWVDFRFGGTASLLQPWQSIVLAGCIGLGLCLMVQVMNWLIAMYREFSGNEPLSVKAAGSMHSASVWLFAFAIYVFAVEAPISFVSSFYNPVGERFVSLQLGTVHFVSLLTAAVFMSVAHLQKHASEVREDQKLIV